MLCWLWCLPVLPAQRLPPDWWVLFGTDSIQSSQALSHEVHPSIWTHRNPLETWLFFPGTDHRQYPHMCLPDRPMENHCVRLPRKIPVQPSEYPLRSLFYIPPHQSPVLSSIRTAALWNCGNPHRQLSPVRMRRNRHFSLPWSHYSADALNRCRDYGDSCISLLHRQSLHWSFQNRNIGSPPHLEESSRLYGQCSVEYSEIPWHCWW